MKQPTRGRFAPPSQVPPLAFLFSSSFEFTFNLNYDKKVKKFTFYWSFKQMGEELKNEQRGNLRGGREASRSRLLHPLRFCFRLRLNLRLI